MANQEFTNAQRNKRHAQAQAAAIQELRETRNQTAQEAHSGDRQAQKLLAKEDAAQSVNQ
jgi:hypothetical protein